jgi:hypothetical protein
MALLAPVPITTGFHLNGRAWACPERSLLLGVTSGGPQVDDLPASGTLRQWSVPPHRIGTLTGMDGVACDEAWDHRVSSTYGDQPCQRLNAGIASVRIFPHHRS